MGLPVPISTLAISELAGPPFGLPTAILPALPPTGPPGPTGLLLDPLVAIIPMAIRILTLAVVIVDFIQVAKVVHRYKVVVAVLANTTATWVEAANVYRVVSAQTLQLQLQLHPRPFCECKHGQKDTIAVVIFPQVVT